MRKLYLTLSVLMVAGIAAAQSTSFTLEQCVDYALKNAISVQNAQLDEKISIAKVKEVTGLGMPQVSGAVQLSYNNKLRRFFAENIDTVKRPDAFGFVRNVPGAEDRDIVASPNFFQLKGAGDASITVSQLVFNGSYFVGLQAAKGLKELSVRNTTTTKVGVIEQVTKAYYLATINKERINLFNSNISRLDTLLRNTKALNANGFTEDIDVDRLQVTMNNLITEREKFMNLQTLSLELLKFQMNYPLSETLEIQGDITTLNPVIDESSYKNGWDYQVHPDYQVLETNRKLQTLNIKNYRSQALPTVSLFANIGASTQSATIGGLFKTNTAIETTELVGPDKWYGYSLFGMNINVPIFSGFQLRYKTQQEKFSLLKIENGMKQLKTGIELETRNSIISYQNAIKSMEAQKRNVDLSNKIARVTKIKYEQGVGSNIEVIDAENTLKESQINYYNALYDALVAKVNLDKAYGRLLPETKN